jgi:hypothetical protein
MAKKKAGSKKSKFFGDETPEVELSEMPSDELSEDEQLELEQPDEHSEPEEIELSEDEVEAHKAKLAQQRLSRKVPKKMHKFQK